MKKIIFFVSIILLSTGVSSIMANNAGPKSKIENATVPAKANKLSEEEISRLTKRVEEIRKMDKTNLTYKEKRALKKELNGIKESVKKGTEVIYISTGTLILIIILLILLV